MPHGEIGRRAVARVVRDRNMPVKLNGKIHRTVVKPTFLYGADTVNNENPRKGTGGE